MKNKYVKKENRLKSKFHLGMKKAKVERDTK